MTRARGLYSQDFEDRRRARRNQRRSHAAFEE